MTPDVPLLAGVTTPLDLLAAVLFVALFAIPIGLALVAAAYSKAPSRLSAIAKMLAGLAGAILGSYLANSIYWNPPLRSARL